MSKYNDKSILDGEVLRRYSYKGKVTLKKPPFTRECGRYIEGDIDTIVVKKRFPIIRILLLVCAVILAILVYTRREYITLYGLQSDVLYVNDNTLSLNITNTSEEGRAFKVCVYRVRDELPITDWYSINTGESVGNVPLCVKLDDVVTEVFEMHVSVVSNGKDKIFKRRVYLVNSKIQ